LAKSNKGNKKNESKVTPANTAAVQAPSAGSQNALVKFWTTKSPILRFVLLFMFLMVIFYLIWVQAFFQDNVIPIVNGINAKIATFFLNLMGQGCVSEGQKILPPTGSAINIKTGCDAIEPIALFCSAIISFPVAFFRKWKGLIVGVLFLLAMNMVRIVSLYFFAVYKPEWFEIMHADVWQAVFILLAVMCWLVWMQTVNNQEAKEIANAAS